MTHSESVLKAEAEGILAWLEAGAKIWAKAAGHTLLLPAISTEEGHESK